MLPQAIVSRLKMMRKSSSLLWEQRAEQQTERDCRNKFKTFLKKSKKYIDNEESSLELLQFISSLSFSCTENLMRGKVLLQLEFKFTALYSCHQRHFHIL